MSRRGYDRVSISFSFVAGFYPRYIPVGDIPFDREQKSRLEEMSHVSLGSFVTDLHAQGFALESANRQFWRSEFRLRFIFAHVSVLKRTARNEFCEDVFLAALMGLAAESFWTTFLRLDRQKMQGRCNLAVLCSKPDRRVDDRGGWLPGFSPELPNPGPFASLRLDWKNGAVRLHRNRVVH